jgi:hypothetical protein
VLRLLPFQLTWRGDRAQPAPPAPSHPHLAPFPTPPTHPPRRPSDLEAYFLDYNGRLGVDVLRHEMEQRRAGPGGGDAGGAAAPQQAADSWLAAGELGSAGAAAAGGGAPAKMVLVGHSMGGLGPGSPPAPAARPWCGPPPMMPAQQEAGATRGRRPRAYAVLPPRPP